MKKQTLNEDISRIKGMMRKLNEEMEDATGDMFNRTSFDSPSDYPQDEEYMLDVEGVKKYLHEVANQVEGIAEEFRNKLGDTDFWPYVKDIYNTLRNFSDVDSMHSDSDQQSGNITHVINHIDSDFSEGSNDY